MADHKSYEESIRDVYKGLGILGAVTLIEVFISLLGKGHMGIDVSGYSWLLSLVALGLIMFSVYKAYFIIFQFMHMAHETKGMALSVLVPTLLLVWAIIAFFQEGNSWKERRQDSEKREHREITPKQESMNLEEDIFIPFIG